MATRKQGKVIGTQSVRRKRSRAAKSPNKTPTEPFLLSPRGYRAWRDRLKGDDLSPTIAFREATVAIFRVVEWSLLTGAVWALGSWVDSQFLLGAATFLMFVLTAYILSFILSFGEAKGTTRPINFLVMGLLAFVVLTAASNFTRMVVLYGGQQLQQLPPPEDPVPFRITP